MQTRRRPAAAPVPVLYSAVVKDAKANATFYCSERSDNAMLAASAFIPLIKVGPFALENVNATLDGFRNDEGGKYYAVSVEGSFKLPGGVNMIAEVRPAVDNTNKSLLETRRGSLIMLIINK